MVGRYSLAFTVAVGVALLGTEVLRRVALHARIVDEPGPAKTHLRPTPYLGGVAVAAAAFAGSLFAPRVPLPVALTALAAATLVLVGLVDDAWGLGPLTRLTAQVGAAAAVIVAGVHAEPTGTVAIDVAITLVWVVGITNALNLLDNMDGLAAGTGAVACAGVFALAVLSGQSDLAVVMAATGGACFGFLAHNVCPASIFMGDAGALFLGFVLAVAAIEVVPAAGHPGSLAVPLILLALPALDTTTVTIGRFRHHLPVASGGKDHLSHRLVARGLSPGPAVGVLLGIQVLLTATAVPVGSGLFAPWLGLVLAVASLAGLAIATMPAAVYPEAAVRLFPPRTTARRDPPTSARFTSMTNAER